MPVGEFGEHMRRGVSRLVVDEDRFLQPKRSTVGLELGPEVGECHTEGIEVVGTRVDGDDHRQLKHPETLALGLASAGVCQRESNVS